MQTPTIHLNGTSSDELLEQFTNARAALHVAGHALKRCAPHQRDYYPQTAEAYDTAQKEHLARLRVINDLREELGSIVTDINYKLSATRSAGTEGDDDE